MTDYEIPPFEPLLETVETPEEEPLLETVETPEELDRQEAPNITFRAYHNWLSEESLKLQAEKQRIWQQSIGGPRRISRTGTEHRKLA